MKALAAFYFCALMCAATGAQAAGAEYAIRWDTAKGGPADLAAAAKALDMPLDTGKNQAMTVTYYTVGQAPADAPAGFEVSLRERLRPKAETTLKYRGTAALPAGTWTCPLPGKLADPPKDEVDISVLQKSEETANSRSCTVNGTVAGLDPAKFKPAKKGCTATMRRVKFDALTIEEWKLDTGGVLIEVSANATTEPKDLAAFRARVADKLLAKGINPLAKGMSQLGTACR